MAHAHSDVVIDRDLGKGITVKVDSIARGIEIVGVGTIGVIRSVATSTATGRSKGGKETGAKGTFVRTICGVNLPTFKEVDCLTEEQQRAFVGRLNDVLGSRGRARLRNADAGLAAGSPSGYRAAVQRDRDDAFADRVIDRDPSLAVPGFELTLFMGDGAGSVGAARQIFHFAGAQASTSYGIACLYGEVDGRCAKAGESPSFTGSDGGGPGEAVHGPVTSVTGSEGTDGTTALSPIASPKGESRLVRLLKAPFRAVAAAVRLLFNNPRELGLMAAVWALLYAPCWLGERRRSIAALRASRAAFGGAA